jgi:hypothetical protein
MFVILVLSFIASTHQLVIPYLGNRAKIGQFYNVRTNQFSNRKIIDGLIDTTRDELSGSTNFNLDIVESSADFMDKMAIDIATQVSVLSGRFTLDASAAYTKITKSSFKQIVGTIVLLMVKETEEFDIFDPTIRQDLRIENADASMTHVLIGIRRGLKVDTLLSQSDSSSEDSSIVAVKLKADMGTIVNSVKASGGVSVENSRMVSTKRFSAKIHCNFPKTN